MTDLPSGWACATLGDLLLRIEAGKSFTCEPRPAEKNEWGVIKVSAMTYGAFREEENKAVPAHQSVDPANEIKPGDILVSRASGTREYVGAPVMVGDCRPRLLLSDKSLRLIPSTWVDRHWLLQALASPEVRAQISAEASGTNSLRNISQQALSAVEMLVPPLAEQKRIVLDLKARLVELEEVAALLSSAAIRLAGLREFVLGAVCTGRLLGIEVVDEAIEPDSAGVVDGDLPSIPQDWRWVRLGTIADLVGGVTKDTKKQMDVALPLVPYLRVANVQRMKLDLRDIACIRVPAAKAEQLALQAGDVLLNEGGDRDKLGRGWIWEEQIDHCIHQNHVFRARVLDGILHPKLLAWHANSFGRGWFERNGKQSVNLASISLSKLKLFPVPVPPSELQEALVERAELLLGMIETSEALVERTRIQLTSLRQRLVTDAFEGRLVEQAADDEPADVLLDRIRAERAAAAKAGSRRRHGASRIEAKRVSLPPGSGGVVPAGAQESLFEQEEVSS
ncbi:hypothetical protein [Nonomuraea sp. NPDC052265]|uniref:hypothetical protein n=1 Tax=Nonomuraea sp. NPDC052265 TaxID=3364374 RepID=UPI0037C895DB